MGKIISKFLANRKKITEVVDNAFDVVAAIDEMGNDIQTVKTDVADTPSTGIVAEVKTNTTKSISTTKSRRTKRKRRSSKKVTAVEATVESPIAESTVEPDVESTIESSTVVPIVEPTVEAIVELPVETVVEAIVELPVETVVESSTVEATVEPITV